MNCISLVFPSYPLSVLGPMWAPLSISLSMAVPQSVGSAVAVVGSAVAVVGSAVAVVGSAG